MPTTTPTNILYFGDNLHVLRDRIPDGSVDLIYLDPPFSSARNYFVIFKDRTGSASRAQEEAFSDTWSWTDESEAAFKELLVSCPNADLSATIKALRSFLKESPMMAYLVSMAIRLFEMHRVLAPAGSLYLHCDPVASHYLKILLDTIFGPNDFRNEIVWRRADAHNDAKHQFGGVGDRILFYVRSKDTVFRPQHGPFPERTLKLWYQHLELPDGTCRLMTKEENETQRVPPGARRFNRDNMSSPNPRPNLMYDYKDWKHPPNGWRYSREMMAELDAKGLLWFPAKKDGRLMRKRYLDEQEGAPIGDVWTDISQIRGGDPEQLGYPTQKPLALLKRIVSASSSPGDVVLDPYCGCGTAVVAAHELGRRWIGIDITAVAVGVIKSRLEQHFDDLKGKVIVEGFPRDLESARSLFEQDKHRFQIWACTLIDAFPLTKKGADAGIDGWRNFVDYDDEPHRAVVQVKGGKSVQVKEVRDFCHVVEREGAAMGYFLVTCKADVTKPMQQEAVKMGYWTSVGKRDYPRVQILSVEGLLDGSEAPKLPPQDKASLLGYKAGAASKTGLQGELFGD